MLFRESFHAGIRDGSVTLTFRTWKSARVSVGRSYRFGRGDALEVTAVEPVPVASITRADARRAGFRSREELLEVLRETAPGRLTARTKVFRVTFSHAGRRVDPRVALRKDVSAGALNEIEERIARAKRPWALEALRLIERRPRVAAAKLAASLGLET